MCLICVDIQKDKLTSLEARRNLGDIGPSIPKEHKLEVLKLIWEKEDQEYIEWYEKEKAANEPPPESYDCVEQFWGEDWMWESGSDQKIFSDAFASF